MSDSYREDVAFLRDHVEVIELGDLTSGGLVAVVPAWQGRVATSAVTAEGAGFGWLNRELIASRQFVPHINPFGGEDRFWIGPEAGQFGVFFEPGSSFDLDAWQTPAAIDTEPYKVVERTDRQVTFGHDARFRNWSGTVFDVAVERTVRMLEPGVLAGLGVDPDGVEVVAFETDNRIRNTGDQAWTQATGLLSIWIIGMFRSSPATTVVLPFQADGAGAVVNDAYFGKVPGDRLVVDGSVVFFRGDGQHRSKIGLTPQRARPVLGSYDPAVGLTLVEYDLPTTADDYVNSMWEHQAEPYRGDVVNSYNDGPPAPGQAQLGAFYELETSSPAAALQPNETTRHCHRTVHVVGPEGRLDQISEAVLGVGLGRIRSAFVADQ